MCIKSEFKEICLKLATNGRSDKGFLLTSNVCPQGVFCPCPGAIYRPLPLCRLGISRYYHLCRSDFLFLTFFSIYLCISTPSMSKTVNMKQRVSRGDFSCPRRIFYYICYCLCRIQNSALTWAPYSLLWLCTCIT